MLRNRIGRPSIMLHRAIQKNNFPSYNLQENVLKRKQQARRSLGFFQDLKKTIVDDLKKNEALKKAIEEFETSFSKEGAKHEESIKKAGESIKKAEEMASNTSKKASEAAKKAEEYAESLKSNETVGKVSESVKNMFSKGTEEASKAAKKAEELAADAAKRAREATNEASKRAEQSEFVKEARSKIEDATQELNKQSWFASTSSKLQQIEFRRHFGEAWDGLVGNDPRKTPTGRWIKRKSPEGKDIYFHTGSGVEQEEVPENYIEPTVVSEESTEAWTGTTQVVAQRGDSSAWEKIVERLAHAPIIEDILRGVENVKKSEVGKSAAKVKETLDDARDSFRETWETSQNPWVYRASAAYDVVFGDNEMAAAIRETRRHDENFDVHEFAADMEATTIPYVIAAFLDGNNNNLRHICSEGAYAAIYAAIKNRSVMDVYPQPGVLDLRELELRAAKVMNKGLPIFVYSCQAQQINCARNKNGEIVEGSDDSVVAVYYAFAMQQEFVEESNTMEWKLVELQVAGAQEMW